MCPWSSLHQLRRGLTAGPEVWLGCAAFAALCVAVLVAAPHLVEPDDYAYRASIVAITDGHFLTLSTAQFQALATQLSGGPGGGPGIGQWVHLPSGRWISEKDPGYPFLAAPFQALGIIRLAPLFYGGLGCLGLFFGARRWLGRWGGAAAVGLFCTSGASLLFAWRDYMPTFTDASLIAAGTGALVWMVLASEASGRRRTVVGLAGFIALEAAVFTRYTDIVVLACAVVAVLVAWRLRGARLPARAVAYWLASVALFAAGVAVFNDLVYGGPLKSGYRPGEVAFSLGAIGPNLRLMPGHLMQAMPMLLLGLGALVWIAVRALRARRGAGEYGSVAWRDLAVAVALAASWFAVWGLYAAYDWTAGGGSTLQVARFYVPAIGAIAMLGAWLLVQAGSQLSVAIRRQPALATVTPVVLAGLFAVGAWSFGAMRGSPFGVMRGPPSGPHGVTIFKGRAPPDARRVPLPAGGFAFRPGGPLPSRR